MHAATTIYSHLGDQHLTSTLTLNNTPLAAGPIPAAFLGGMPALRALNLSHNRLSGDLQGLGEALGRAPSNSLVSLDLSSNSLSGALPAGLDVLALFDASRADLLIPGQVLLAAGSGGSSSGSSSLPEVKPEQLRQRPPSRLFNVSLNRLTGPFPRYLLTQLPPVVELCRRLGCAAVADVAGPDMTLTCTGGSVEGYGPAGLLAGMSLECVTAAGNRIQVLQYLEEASPGQLFAPAGAGGAGGGGRRALPAGAIAGIVIGSVVGALLLAVVAVMTYRSLHAERDNSKYYKFKAVELGRAAASAYMTTGSMACQDGRTLTKPQQAAAVSLPVSTLRCGSVGTHDIADVGFSIDDAAEASTV